MTSYIYYDGVIVAAIEEGRVTIDPAGVERSGMPLKWVPHIKRLLENSLPEGLRKDTLVRLAARHGTTPSDSLELIPYIADLPGRFSAGDSRKHEKHGEAARRFYPLPDKLPSVAIESRLLLAFFDPLSEPRVNEKPSFSGYQDKFTAHLTVEGDKLFLSPVDQETERGNVIVKPAHLKYPFIAENEYICMELAGASTVNMEKAKKRIEQSISGGATQMLKAISQIKAKSNARTPQLCHPKQQQRR